ncbi:MAG: WD40 repeat domain-containing protein [Bacteroidales bacterium]|nr:WD40 repeat domain-containing protein [Bacteroidales bacterium]
MKGKIYLIFGLVILFFALPFQSAFSQRQKSFVCVKTIKSSQSRINSAEFSPDGKYILSVAEDRMIKTRNANNYQLRLVIEKHKRFFISTSFSNEGAVRKRICWDKGHQTLDPFSPNTLKGKRLYSADAKTASYSPDGKHIISVLRNGNIKIWDAISGKSLKTLKGHSSYVNSAEYSPCGKYIVSTSSDETLKIWDANSGNCLQTLKGHEDSVITAKYSPDGTKIISGSRDGIIKIWQEK